MELNNYDLAFIQTELEINYEKLIKRIEHYEKMTPLDDEHKIVIKSHLNLLTLKKEKYEQIISKLERRWYYDFYTEDKKASSWLPQKVSAKSLSH